MLFTAAAAGFSAFQLQRPHDHFITAIAPAQPADPVVFIVFHTTQGGEFTEYSSCQIFGSPLGRILFWNAAAVGDVSAYEFPPRCQSFTAAVALTAPADNAFAIPKAGIFYHGQVPELFANQISHFRSCRFRNAAAILNRTADELMAHRQHLATTITAAPPKYAVAFSLARVLYHGELTKTASKNIAFLHLLSPPLTVA